MAYIFYCWSLLEATATMFSLMFRRHATRSSLVRNVSTILSSPHRRLRLTSAAPKHQKALQPMGCIRSFSSNEKNEKDETKQDDSTVDKEATQETPQKPSKPFGLKLKEWGSFFVENVKLAYAEMTSNEKESLLERKLHTAESFRAPKQKSEDGEDHEEEEVLKDAGPNAIVLVKEGKSPWEQMKERLQDSPFIRDILKRSRVVGQAAAQTDLGKQAQNIGTSVKDKVEDLRNFWDTSQNPLVYTLSGVWDNMTGETEEAMTIAEIRKLDSKFVPEEWSEEVREKLAPLIIKAHLRGDTAALKPWLGEAVYNKLAADIRVRKTDGYVFDSNLLGIDENQMIMKLVEGGSPVIVVVYMVQQINCIKNRKGEIVEGSETDIRAKFYSLAFQQYFDEEVGSVKWKIVDYEFAGDMPYY